MPSAQAAASFPAWPCCRRPSHAPPTPRNPRPPNAQLFFRFHIICFLGFFFFACAHYAPCWSYFAPGKLCPTCPWPASHALLEGGGVGGHGGQAVEEWGFYSGRLLVPGNLAGSLHRGMRMLGLYARPAPCLECCIAAAAGRPDGRLVVVFDAHTSPLCCACTVPCCCA